MRDERIDILRFIGLFMIVLAHVGPPGALFQLRNFDVPLMVVVSGLSFRASYRDEPYGTYLWKRIKRLVLPVWLFLSIYFLTMLATGHPTALPDARAIASSYALLEGIGYVWIIRVFLLVALVSPALLSWSRRTVSDRRYLLLLAAGYAAYELLFLACRPFLQSGAGILFQDTVLYLLPYAAVFAIGLRLPQWPRSRVVALAALAFAVFAGLGVIYFEQSGKAVAVQAFKYPPRAYYLSYGLLVSCLAWLSAHAILTAMKFCKVIGAVNFIAQNSIWIYLWHIPFIEIVRFPYYLKFPLVFAAASALTFVQVKVITGLILPTVKVPALKRNLQSILMG